LGLKQLLIFTRQRTLAGESACGRSNRVSYFVSYFWDTTLSCFSKNAQMTSVAMMLIELLVLKASVIHHRHNLTGLP
jgi:hypothetical protein